MTGTRRLVGAGAAGALALLLGGCGGPAPETGASSTPSPSLTAETTPSATPTPTVEPEPEPTEEPAPPPPASTPLTKQGAYSLCVTVTREYFPEPDEVYAGFGASQVVARTDGLFYVYIEVTIPSAATAAMRDVAAECILGGSVEKPRLELYGARTRAPASERDPNAPLPTG